VGFVKDKIPGPIKKALGIQSPSKVAALLGRQVPAGLAQGITKNGAIVTKAATNMANNAIANLGDPLMGASLALGGVAANATGAGGNTTTQSVNIENVNLGDASAVREFFRQLNQDTINVGMGLTANQGAQI
jgi:hypothetical protein